MKVYEIKYADLIEEFLIQAGEKIQVLSFFFLLL